MTAFQAKLVERAIIGLCVLSILAIFQPFTITLFSIGCAAVVVGALAFNLVPMCREGIAARTLLKISGVILLILCIAAALGMGTALLYVEYLASTR